MMYLININLKLIKLYLYTIKVTLSHLLYLVSSAVTSSTVLSGNIVSM